MSRCDRSGMRTRLRTSRCSFEQLESRYVLTSYFVAPTGVDTNPGTLQLPLATVNRGMELAQPGDTVLLRGGVYRETVTSVRSGTPTQPIRLANYNNEVVTISASDVVQGPWTETAAGSGIFYASSPTSLAPTFWTAPTAQAGGTRIVEQSGSLVATVVNDANFQTIATRSINASSQWNFFQQSATWRARGLSIASTGSTALPLANATAYFSIMTGSSNGYASDDSVNVGWNGSGRLSLQLKKDTLNSWGTTVGSLTNIATTGYDLTLEPATATSINYRLTAYPTGQTVATGQWNIASSDWSDGGSGTKSYVQIFAQETVSPAVDTTQRFELRVGSYEITSGGNSILRDEFNDGDVATCTFYPSGRSSLSTGYDQIFVDGTMQQEARMSNKVSSDLLSADAFALTMNNTYQLTSTALSGKPDNFYAGARFVGRVGSGWSWQAAVATGSTGNTVQLDSASASTWWWPNQSSQTSNTGIGYLYGKLEFLDTAGEWFLQANSQGAETLYLKIAAGASPVTHMVERKTRNWTLSLNGHDNIIVSGLNFQGGAVRMNGSGLLLEKADAGYLSHFQTWTNGGAVNGGLAQGSGVLVSGSGNTVRDCTIHDTAGSGIVLTGNDHVVTRNSIFNVDYSGTYATGLSLSGTGHTATFNTIHDAGRDILRPTGSGLTVMYNDLSRAGRLALDLGVIYAWGTNGADAQGRKSRIAYNWIHEHGNTSGSLSMGIYLDNFTRNYIIDHNVVFDFQLNGQTADGVRLNAPAIGMEVYHNTIVAAHSYDYSTYTPFPNSNADATFWTTMNHGLDYIAKNNLTIAVGANLANSFVDYAARDFRPLVGTSAIDPATSSSLLAWSTTNGVTNVPASFHLSMQTRNQYFYYNEVKGNGVAVAGINEGYVGSTPDNGAYEVGGAFWVPGVAGYISANAPTDITISANQVIENVAAGAIVGSVQAVDPDIGDPNTLMLVSGVGDTDNGRFILAGNILRTSSTFDYETKTSYSIRLRATDRAGRAVERVLAITVADLPELLGEASVGDLTPQRSMVSQLTISFDGAVDVASGAFSLIQRGTNLPVTLNAPSIQQSVGRTTVTLTFQGSLTRAAGALVDGFYQLSIDGSKISRAGLNLDVNRDGVGSDTYLFGDVEADQFFALYGDTNGDGLVGVAEFGQFRSTFGRLPGEAGYDALFDYDGSGVGVSDFGQFRSRFGKRLLW